MALATVPTSSYAYCSRALSLPQGRHDSKRSSAGTALLPGMAPNAKASAEAEKRLAEERKRAEEVGVRARGEGLGWGCSRW